MDVGERTRYHNDQLTTAQSEWVIGESVCYIFLDHLRSEARSIGYERWGTDDLVIPFEKIACTCKAFLAFLDDEHVKEYFSFEGLWLLNYGTLQ